MKHKALMRGAAAWAIVSALLTLAFGAPAAVTFSASSGSRSACVAFDIDLSGNLRVALNNTSVADTLVPSEVLTAVFFNIAGNPTLTRLTGVLAPGSQVFYDPDGQPPGGVIGGEWAYRNGLSQYGANSGISSAGLGLFGPGDRFPGNDLAPPLSPDGIQYGLLSAGDNPTTQNGGLAGSGGLIRNAVIFTLGNLPLGFTLAQISNVTFQYGTGFDEPHLAVAVPEPSTFLAGALLLIPLVAQLRRRKPGV